MFAGNSTLSTAMKEASDWMAYYKTMWEHQMDNLQAYLNQLPQEEDGD